MSKQEMGIPTRLLLSVLAGLFCYGAVKFGGWVGSLTTTRTPFYFTLNNIWAWVMGIVGFIYAMVNSKKS